jgi:hypothetical protein
MPHLKNSILARASPVDLQNLLPHHRLLELEQVYVIAESRMSKCSAVLKVCPVARVSRRRAW